MIVITNYPLEPEDRERGIGPVRCVRLLICHKWSKWAFVRYKGRVYSLKKFYLLRPGGRRINWKRFNHMDSRGLRAAYFFPVECV